MKLKLLIKWNDEFIQEYFVERKRFIEEIDWLLSGFDSIVDIVLEV